MAQTSKKGSGQRSGLYSESKFTNWRDFDPYEEEIGRLAYKTKATMTYETALGDHIAIICCDTHSKFVQPVTSDDVYELLSHIPPEYLADLTKICLLGGTNKQDRVASGSLFHYGSYRFNTIYLNAFPQRLLSECCHTLPAPHIV
jgi:hypothetical protein